MKRMIRRSTKRRKQEREDEDFYMSLFSGLFFLIF